MPLQTPLPSDAPVIAEWQGLRIPAGLTAVTGDEGSGKTALLQHLAAQVQDGLWLDLRLPEHDEQTPHEVWARLQTRCPHWNEDLRAELSEALSLNEHLGKKLFMLSAGSRRKVALVALLASGATLTCLDQPYAALDLGSAAVLREFLSDMADHPTRAWVVADHEADESITWRSLISSMPNFGAE